VGFGKRGGPRRPDAPMRSDMAEGPVDLDSVRAVSASDGLSTTLLTGILAFVAIAVGAGSALLFASPFSSAPEHSFGAVSTPPPATGAHARIADMCMPALKPGGIRKIGVTDDQLRYTRALHSPAYFNCALAMERERFCASTEKEILVKELQAYFGDIAAKQRIIDRYSNDPSAKTMMKMADAVEGKDGGISAGRRPMPDAGVVELLKGLVRDGYLRGADFGWSVPPEISIHIKEVQRDKTSC
jgi:hypothetical protein